VFSKDIRSHHDENINMLLNIPWEYFGVFIDSSGNKLKILELKNNKESLEN